MNEDVAVVDATEDQGKGESSSEWSGSEAPHIDEENNADCSTKQKKRKHDRKSKGHHKHHRKKKKRKKKCKHRNKPTEENKTEQSDVMPIWETAGKLVTQDNSNSSWNSIIDDAIEEPPVGLKIKSTVDDCVVGSTDDMAGNIIGGFRMKESNKANEDKDNSGLNQSPFVSESNSITVSTSSNVPPSTSTLNVADNGSNKIKVVENQNISMSAETNVSSLLEKLPPIEKSVNSGSTALIAKNIKQEINAKKKKRRTSLSSRSRSRSYSKDRDRSRSRSSSRSARSYLKRHKASPKHSRRHSSRRSRSSSRQRSRSRSRKSRYSSSRRSSSYDRRHLYSNSNSSHRNDGYSKRKYDHRFRSRSRSSSRDSRSRRYSRRDKRHSRSRSTSSSRHRTRQHRRRSSSSSSTSSSDQCNVKSPSEKRSQNEAHMVAKSSSYSCTTRTESSNVPESLGSKKIEIKLSSSKPDHKPISTSEKPKKTSLIGEWTVVEKHVGDVTPSNPELAKLTEFCKTLSKSEKVPLFRPTQSVGTVTEDVSTPAIHHPFVMAPAPILPPMGIAQTCASYGAVHPSFANIRSMIMGKITEEFPVSSGIQHRDTADPLQPGGAASTGTVFSPEAKKNVDVSAVIARRLKAQQQLAANPMDASAVTEVTLCDAELQHWSQSKLKPGQFLGTTSTVALQKYELEQGYQAWARKDMFHSLPPIRGGVGMRLLQKMGWSHGQPLGKRREGFVQPIALDVKMDRKGLTTAEDQKARGKNKAIVDVKGKHPVSLLSEWCTKKRLGQPSYDLVMDDGPAHNKKFLYKVVIQGTAYQSQFPSANKKQAKAEGAMAALKGRGFT